MSGYGSVLAASAGMLAMMSGACLGDAVYQWAHRRSLAASMLAPSRRGQLLLKLQGGVGPLRPLARKILERIPYMNDTCQRAVTLIGERGVALTEEALLSLLLAASLAVALVGGILLLSPTFGIALGLITFAASVAYARNKSERQDLAMREQVPEALRTLCMSFRSGHSLPQTLAAASKETDGYLGHLFSITADRLEMGATTTEALAVLRENPRLPELSFVAVALDVQHESGGSIAPVLEAATDSVEGELRLMRSLRVQTAQAKLSASIVTVMPFILVALFSLMSPDFLTPFFSSFLGMALLALALAMQVIGVMIVRSMLKVEVS